MSIIGALPVNLTNGTTADATQVMSNFSSIVSQVNANGAALAGGNAFTGAQTIAGDAVVTAAATQTLSGKTLTGPNGTVGAPTYSFSLSTSTGFWSPSTNAVGISTNGINAVYVDASQNVGIGKTPASVLDVSSASTNVGNNSITLTNTQSSSGVQISVTGTSFTLGGVNGSTAFIAPSTSNTNLAIGNLGGTGVIQLVAGGAERVKIDSVGRLSGTFLHNNASLPSGTAAQYIASGTYTPSITNTINISSATAGTFQWIRVGNVVTVSGIVTVVPTATSNTQFRASLPISSSTANLAGAIGNNGSVSGLGIVSNSGTANAFGTAASTASSAWCLTFTYEVA